MLAPRNYVNGNSNHNTFDTNPNQCNTSNKLSPESSHPYKCSNGPEKTFPVAEGRSKPLQEGKIIIYSTVDACPNACEMWKAIKRLKQGDSINVQDLETNLY
ncbi:hypothetical protein Tco_0907468 [Tanacetum coccineum]|uniref:Uncharacterized protein n=1 Tax=Tanacetum coccineum TaxID=301880 RepID=A0ABQ5CMN8_9ASTR